MLSNVDVCWFVWISGNLFMSTCRRCIPNNANALHNKNKTTKQNAALVHITTHDLSILSDFCSALLHMTAWFQVSRWQWHTCFSSGPCLWSQDAAWLSQPLALEIWMLEWIHSLKGEGEHNQNWGSKPSMNMQDFGSALIRCKEHWTTCHINGTEVLLFFHGSFVICYCSKKAISLHVTEIRISDAFTSSFKNHRWAYYIKHALKSSRAI